MDTFQGMDARYDEDYFIRGKQTGKSLYENYRWLPDLTIPMAEHIVDHCGIELSDRILDFGCARGYLVKALRVIGHDAIGYDVSDWALRNADPDVVGHVSNEWPPQKDVDWIIAKDVLEHIPDSKILPLVREMAAVAKKGIFIVVPLASIGSHLYLIPEYEMDVTHVIRWSLVNWSSLIVTVMPDEWEMSFRYRINGIKDNYAKWSMGNGFITCRKI